MKLVTFALLTSVALTSNAFAGGFGSQFSDQSSQTPTTQSSSSSSSSVSPSYSQAYANISATAQGGSVITDGGISGTCTVTAWAGSAGCSTGGTAQTEVKSLNRRVLTVNGGTITQQSGFLGKTEKTRTSYWSPTEDSSAKSSSHSSIFGSFGTYNLSVSEGIDETITESTTSGSTFLDTFAITHW